MPFRGNNIETTNLNPHEIVNLVTNLCNQKYLRSLDAILQKEGDEWNMPVEGVFYSVCLWD